MQTVLVKYKYSYMEWSGMRSLQSTVTNFSSFIDAPVN